jgi:hypothetical protein
VPNLSALLQLRDSTVQLLDLYLKSFDSRGEYSQLHHGDRSVRALTTRGVGYFLEAINDHFEDGGGFQGACVDDRRTLGFESNERLQIRQSGDQDFVGAPFAAAEPIGGLNGDVQVSRNHKVFVWHESSPSLVAGVSSVGDGRGRIERKGVDS